VSSHLSTLDNLSKESRSSSSCGVKTHARSPGGLDQRLDDLLCDVRQQAHRDVAATLDHAPNRRFFLYRGVPATRSFHKTPAALSPLSPDVGARASVPCPHRNGIAFDGSTRASGRFGRSTLTHGPMIHVIGMAVQGVGNLCSGQIQPHDIPGCCSPARGEHPSKVRHCCPARPLQRLVRPSPGTDRVHW
jgi:hypothetical protein